MPMQYEHRKKKKGKEKPVDEPVCETILPMRKHTAADKYGFAGE